MIGPEEMTDEFRFYLLRKRQAEDQIVNAFRGFRQRGIEPILIKGWAAARNYPEFKPRFSGDIDLAVAASDYEAAKDLLNETEGSIGGVDLHRELRHLDTLEWPKLYSNSELVALDNASIRILSPEDHLRVLCVHWLTNGGESRERLFDIVYAVRNRPAEFDWAKCLGVVSAIRRKWIISTIGLAHKYLDLELDGIPFAEEAKRLPDWLTRCVEKEWASGVELRALESLIRNPRAFLQQARKRIPPNPIQATINCEGGFDDTGRLIYQLRDMLKRFRPSIRRISGAVMER